MTTSTVPEPGVPVQEFLKSHQKMLINGKRVDAASGETFDVSDPSNNQLLAKVPKGSEEDINRAVNAARQAFDSGSWRKLTVSERGKMIWKLADLIEERTEEFAQLETLDNFEPGDRITPEELLRRGYLKNLNQPVKIVGDGEINKAVIVAAHKFTRSARGKIEAAQGTVEEL